MRTGIQSSRYGSQQSTRSEANHSYYMGGHSGFLEHQEKSEVNASHMNLALVGKFSSHPPTTLKFGNQGSESWKAGGLRPTIDGVMGSKPLGIDEVAKSQLVIGISGTQSFTLARGIVRSAVSRAIASVTARDVHSLLGLVTTVKVVHADLFAQFVQRTAEHG